MPTSPLALATLVAALSSLGACASSSPRDQPRGAHHEAKAIAVEIDTSVAATCRLAASRTYFPYASAEISAADKTIILDVARCMKPGGALAGRSLLVTGYTDDDGTRNANSDLGMTRGQAVARELMDQGIGAERIYIRTMGERRASIDGDKAYDRKVELRVLSLD